MRGCRRSRPHRGSSGAVRGRAGKMATEASGTLGMRRRCLVRIGLNCRCGAVDAEADGDRALHARGVGFLVLICTGPLAHGGQSSGLIIRWCRVRPPGGPPLRTGLHAGWAGQDTLTNRYARLRGPSLSRVPQSGRGSHGVRMVRALAVCEADPVGDRPTGMLERLEAMPAQPMLTCASPSTAGQARARIRQRCW
jgi:hypothetical protein